MQVSVTQHSDPGQIVLPQSSKEKGSKRKTHQIRLNEKKIYD